MKVILSTVTLFLVSFMTFGQSHLTITGVVANAQTKEPLPFASVSIKKTARGSVAGSNGTFQLQVPRILPGDTLSVTHVGYEASQIALNRFIPGDTIYLEESYIFLDVVTISRVAVSTRNIEKDLRLIRGNLYAMETEVTNAQYNLFLASLEEQGKMELYRQATYDLSSYDKASQTFFTQYVTQYNSRKTKKDTVKTPHIGPHAWSDYPAVNIRHAAAQQYCEWLTEQYNSYSGKKKFKQVKFRLPSLQEWQVAALGYDKFQSWIVADNLVEVIISPDSLDMLPRKGVRKSIPVGNDVLYPWYGSYYYRKSPQNHKNCFLGNFKVEYVERPCPANNPSYDGWSMMGQTASFFPNNIGLYDVVGNVAEMIEEPGMACGGSWNDVPSESTIHSVKRYTRPDATVGFRVFMDVVEN